jgi:hypothetical protein
MRLSRGAKIGLSLVLAVLLALAALWIARATIAARFAERYFRQHGVNSSVEIGMLGLSGVAGRFALGPSEAPELAAERIELFFDPLRWQPYLVEVRLVNPLVRARVDNQGRVTLPSLQAWLDTLGQSREKSPYVSDDLAIAFTGLRALLVTPAGAVEINGDAKIVHNRPESLALSLKPGQFGWEGRQIKLQKAAIALTEAGRMTVALAGDYRDAVATVEGAVLDLALERLVIGADGAITAGPSHATIVAANFRSAAASGSDLRARIDAPQLRFAGTVMETPRLSARITAKALDAKAQLSGLDVTLEARNLRASALDVVGEGDIAMATTATLPADLVGTLRNFPVLAMEPPLAAAVKRNLGPLRISFKAQALRRDGKLDARLTEPLLVRASGGGLLRVEALSLSGTPPAMTGHLRARLSGGGLPPLRLNAQRFTWNGQDLHADVGLDGQINFSALRGVRAGLRGQAHYADGAFSFRQGRCIAASLAALGPLARDIKGTACPAKAPLFTFGPKGWTLAFEARDASGFLPLANADLSGGAALLAFNGTGGLSGTVTVTAAKLADKATPVRFNPITGTGAITLAGGVWRGSFDAATPTGIRLGTATLTHTMATVQGSAHVEAPLVFAEGKLQPESLSPMGAPLRQAAGRADFKGDFTWGPGGLAGHTGTLAVRDFSFLSPMGRASGIQTDLVLTSLLPPATAPGQTLRIARVDWTLPMTAIELRFGFSTTALQVDSAQLNVADGKIALAPFTINPTAPGTIASTATITSFSLAPLIAASNLSGKASLEGELSGTVPFTAGSDGFRITKGRLTSDGAGRLSLNRSLWGDTKVTNVVQDFAFQALENLAFESLAADLNSIDRGRLSMLFHIKGRSDPPKPQIAEIAVEDIVNGTALQKPVPLPSGTPIDLTLDTSLNFDELLKSYAEAWSKSLEGLGAR